MALYLYTSKRLHSVVPAFAYICTDIARILRTWNQIIRGTSGFYTWQTKEFPPVCQSTLKDLQIEYIAGPVNTSGVKQHSQYSFWASDCTTV
jgi:hypothetical protein